MKLGYVAGKHGTLTLTLDKTSSPYIAATLDPQIPQIPQIGLRVDIKGDENIKELFLMATEVLLEDLNVQLMASGIDPNVIMAFNVNLMDCFSQYVNTGDREVKSYEDEPITMAELEFEIPEALIMEAHSKIVTASSDIKRTNRVSPYKRDLSKANIPDYIDPKKTLKKFRNNVYKHTPSKNYIMTYDVNGRPTGMIEAPKSPINYNYKSKLLR